MNDGSSPSGPTMINMLVSKMCNCKAAMYVHRRDPEDVIFRGCEPTIVDMTIEKSKTVPDEIIIKGFQSAHCVRCETCKIRHLLKSFKEIKQ